MSRLTFPFIAFTILFLSSMEAAEVKLTSPDGKMEFTLSDERGLHYKVSLDGESLVTDSRLGMSFEGGLKLGPKAVLGSIETRSADSTWTNPFGKCRDVRNHYNELRVKVTETCSPSIDYGLIIRAYDDGVAFRYDLPKQTNLDKFTITEENTEFAFPGDYRSWLGDSSDCAECLYPEKKLSQISGNRHTLPLLVELPNAVVAVTESDLIDWAGMYLEKKEGLVLQTDLSPRQDKHELVVSQTPRVSPWRVIMIGRDPGVLFTSCLVENLATPSKIGDVSWIHPGVTAWDPWWANLQETRGNTEMDKPYIDLASTYGWSYQLVDWGWNKGDDATAGPVDVPELVKYAAQKNVKLLLWMHNQDLNRTGIDRAFTAANNWGVAGVKIDFMNSNSQEMVNWYYNTLSKAAEHKLLVDFHGAYVPTGLARTFPNYITQEGVRGNEYNKGWNGGEKETAQHTINLAFTRDLLGPMDFTPGGFRNATPAQFTNDVKKAPDGNTEVIGTRARQLAMTVIYASPLLCLCDSPKSYLNQPGVDFFRSLPTVWDRTVVPSTDICRHIVVARQTGERWYLGAMNQDDALALQVPLTFLGSGMWIVHSFADESGGTDPKKIVETKTEVTAGDSVRINMSSAGGYAAIIEPKK